MLIPAFLALLSAPLLPPVTLPPLTSPELQSHVFAVEQALEKGDFVKANTLAATLPRRAPQILWDERKVPAAQREEFRSARDNALQTWKRLAKVGGVFSPTGKDLKISFEPELAPDLDLEGPAPVVAFISQTAPRVESVIGLQRGTPLLPATPIDVFNGVLYSLGSYYGLARNQVTATAMTLGPNGTSTPHGISNIEASAARQLMAAFDNLRLAVKNKQRMRAGKATAFVDPAQFRGEVVQGDDIEMPVQITNTGNAPLSFAVEGDCGCIVTEPPGTIPANSSQIVQVKLDTKEFLKVTERRIRVFTNDMSQPVRIIPVMLDVTPRFRFISPGGSTFEMGEKAAEFDVYLSIADGVDAEVVQAGLSGVTGKVVGEKWSGDVTDPDTKKTVPVKKGYKFHITIPGPLPSARSMVGLNIATNLAASPNLSFPLTIQRGIVALPEELYVGELGKAPKVSHVTVVRAGAPLKVKSVSIDAKSMTVKLVPQVKSTEQRIEVIYDGTAPSGDLSATITIVLDDPRQPEIKVPVVGSVK